MSGMQAATEIERPVEDVYAFFLDLDQSIVPTDSVVRSVVKTTEGPVGPGTTFRIRQRVLGRVRDQMLRIVAIEPNRRIDMEARFGPVRPLFSLTFEPTATGTRVTFRGDSRPVGPLSLFPSLADRIGERNWRRRLRLTKLRLEGRADRPPA
jgi:uncharacterized protein YndB with AHSA1/START domain